MRLLVLPKAPRKLRALLALLAIPTIFLLLFPPASDIIMEGNTLT